MALGALLTPHVGAAEPQLDAATCSALRAGGERSAAKFSLGARACGGVAALAIAPAGVGRATQRDDHAQHLRLFDAAPAVPATPEAEPPAVAPQPLTAEPAPAAPRRAVAAQRWPAALVRAVGLAPDIERTARAHALDPLLLHAIARVESRHDPAAVSPAGARGVMQVMPATGQRFGAGDPGSLHHAPTNLDVSARYLRTLQRLFPGDLRLVLAAYNAGEGAVLRHGRRVPPYAETRAYVDKVLAEYARLRGAAAQLAGGTPPMIVTVAERAAP